MKDAEVLHIFRQAQIIESGHYAYTRGEHGDTYVNKDAIYAHTKLVSQLCQEIAGRFMNDEIETVVGPAVGGVILSQWTAHHLSAFRGKEVYAVYAEYIRGEFVIRRNYPQLVTGKRVLVVEDILNSGYSAAGVVEAVRAIGGNVIGLGALCNYGRATREMVGNPPRLTELVHLNIKTWGADECPMCKGGISLNTNLGHGGKSAA